MIERLLRKYTLRWSPTMFKVTLGALVLAAFFIPVAIVGIPWVEFLNDMAAQPKAKSQMTYGRVWGEQNLTIRPPVHGTMPRDIEPTYPFRYAGAEIPLKKGEDKFKRELAIAKEVGKQWHNPLEPTMENMKRGQESFNIYCKTCHGKTANGDGPATGPNRFPRPPSLHTDEARGYADGTIFHIVTKGVGKMHGYADKLDEQERWEVILYLRALQRAMNPKEEDLKR